MPPEDQTRLKHMIEAGETVGRLVAGHVRTDPDSDEMLSLALARAIENHG